MTINLDTITEYLVNETLDHNLQYDNDGNSYTKDEKCQCHSCIALDTIKSVAIKLAYPEIN